MRNYQESVLKKQRRDAEIRENNSLQSTPLSKTMDLKSKNLFSNVGQGFIGEAMAGISNAMNTPSRHGRSPLRDRLSSVKVSGSYLDPESPFIKKQEELNKPRRRSRPPRSKLSIQQFVQSDHFQDTFNGLIETLDMHHRTRKQQTQQASAHINKQTFYKMAKDSIVSNAAENPNIDFMHECYEQKVVPFPIFSKVRNSTLNLIDYHLNKGYSLALEKFFLAQSSYESLIDAMIL